MLYITLTYGNIKMTLLSPNEVALMCGYSASQIRRLIRQGVIKAEKINKGYVIHEKDIKNLKRRGNAIGTTSHNKE